MDDSPRRWRYVLPNLLTATSISAAFYGMSAAAQTQYVVAVSMILFSFVLDGLDGRVARMTHTQSAFGVEFDSLADVIAFGMAPAWLLYLSSAQSFGHIGLLVCILFVISGAVRLARFNVMTEEVPDDVFIGLPIPAAAVLVALGVAASEKYTNVDADLPLLISMIILALLMISSIHYPNFKNFNFHAIKNIASMVSMALLMILILFFPLEAVVGLIVLYVVYSPLLPLLHKK